MIISSLGQGKLVTGTSKAWIGGFGEVCPFGLVSDGKSLVASAITEKGIDTASDATFQTMANNIRALPIKDKYKWEKWSVYTIYNITAGSNTVDFKCPSTFTLSYFNTYALFVDNKGRYYNSSYERIDPYNDGSKITTWTQYRDRIINGEQRFIFDYGSCFPLAARSGCVHSYYWDSNDYIRVNYGLSPSTVVPGKENIKETLIGTVESYDVDAYPENGKHTDGYWYVRI